MYQNKCCICGEFFETINKFNFTCTKHIVKQTFENPITGAKQTIEYLDCSNDLKWTKDKPIKEGYYWIKSLMEPKQPCCINLNTNSQLLITFIGDEINYSVKGLHDGYEFYGPIEPPK